MKFSFEGIPQHRGYVEFGYESGTNAGHQPRAYIQFTVGSGAPKALLRRYISVRDEARPTLVQAMAYALNGEQDQASKTFVDALISTNNKDWEIFSDSGYLWLADKTGVLGRAIRVCVDDQHIAGKASAVRILAESLGYRVTELSVSEDTDDQWTKDFLNAIDPKSIIVFTET